MKNRTLIKILRHGSLQINVINRFMKFQSWGYEGKLVILIKKIKVKKLILIHIFRENIFKHTVFTLLKKEKYNLSFDI